MAIGIVSTKIGKMRGEEFDGIYQDLTYFKGVPYAKPPVGKLRWAPPENPEPWDGIRVCETYGPAPIQDFMTLSYKHRREFYFNGFADISEDCLYLNICTGAQKSGEKRPVYMWFHGGGVRYCHANEIEFNPQELARKGIVVVLVGQRLNVFGYIALPQLTAEQGKSGNYGLMDQLKALDWVYENIAAFGGDPDNITVGGQSGGSHKTCTMTASPASKGRVKRVINQTGLNWMRTFPDLKAQERRSRTYLHYAGIDPDLSLDALRALDWRQIYFNETPMSVMLGEMVYDGELVPFQTLRESFDKYLDGVDFINCCNYGESEIFGESLSGFNDIPVGDYIKSIKSAADFYAHYRNLLGDLFDKYDFANMVKVTDKNAWTMAKRLASLGLAGQNIRSFPGGGSNATKNLMLNRIFGMHMAKRYPGSKVYSFLFSHLLPIFEEDRGTEFDGDVALAWHSSELWFTFASLRKGVPPSRPWRDVDFKVADIISSYWANFIRSGDPNGDGLPFWPASGNDYGYMEVDDEARGSKGADSPLDRLLLEFVSAEFKV